MATNNKPATALPWRPWTRRIHHEVFSGDVIVAQVRQCTGPNGSTHLDAAYIAHAANAYPQLIAALRVSARQLSMHGNAYAQDCAALLAELGEDQS